MRQDSTIEMDVAKPCSQAAQHSVWSDGEASSSADLAVGAKLVWRQTVVDRGQHDSVCCGGLTLTTLSAYLMTSATMMPPAAFPHGRPRSKREGRRSHRLECLALAQSGPPYLRLFDLS